jgi:hypothetical protein
MNTILAEEIERCQAEIPEGGIEIKIGLQGERRGYPVQS